MTYILPILTSACLLLAISPLAMSGELPEEIAGDSLIRASVETLLQHPGMEAKIRQRATVFGQRLAGSGAYLQARDGDRLLVRFEFKIQVAERTTSLLQINDGSTLWIRRDVGPTQSQAYIDLRRLREVMRSDAKSETPPGLAQAQTLAIGGLGQVLSSLADQFHFGNVTPTEVSRIPMWELTGVWKRERLLELLPGQRTQIEAGLPPDLTKLPLHMPSTVKLTLGRDHHFPLFPYFIEYGRHQPIPKTVAMVSDGPPVQQIWPIIKMELYEVRRLQDVPHTLFNYSPGDQQSVEDQTESYIKLLQRSAVEP